MQDNVQFDDATIEPIARKLWEERGEPIGTPEEDWYRAVEKLRTEAGAGAQLSAASRTRPQGTDRTARQTA